MKPWEEVIRLFNEQNRLWKEARSNHKQLFLNKNLFLAFIGIVPPPLFIVGMSSQSGLLGFFVSLLFVAVYLILLLFLLVRPDWILSQAYQEYLKVPDLERRVEAFERSSDKSGEMIVNLSDDKRKLARRYDEIIRKKEEAIEKEKELAAAAQNENQDLTQKITLAHRQLDALQTKLEGDEQKIADLREKERGYLERVSLLESEAEAIKARNLEEFQFNDLMQHLINRLSVDSPVEVSTDRAATLYGLMQEHVPDKARLRELSQIPHELQRAQQIELIVERYSEKITEVERSDLSDTEKRDKINAYRLARERELGIEE